MNEQGRNNWSREETILAFDLYCRTPFSKIGKNNESIKALAALIGRTPSAVGLKMANLAHWDPEIIAENKKGMANGSKLDKKIVEEFWNNWEELSYEAQIIKATYYKKNVYEILPDDIQVNEIPEGKDRIKEVKTRIGQNFFRNAVLEAYNNKCCITGLSYPKMLIASHIKPWRDSDPKKERANPSNGLCLNPFHDKAFDIGLITIDKNYNVIISSKIYNAEMSDETRNWFFYYDRKKILLPDKFLPNKEYIEYHNDVIFLK
ncbi:HNH endonuclease [Butyrivibrio fibrisolvens]|uniref:HNH endonuclease n=1 Tax=Pseudobutyrivibrio ruminis TaxID=46206 RepID=UPI0003FC83D4|nr:HNH endonuclease [Pseudobutyrivibrio ruminis]MDC7278060.1 HNH endonuclease [Butyrivibrio fibrisolvens]